MLDIDKLTVGELKQLLALAAPLAASAAARDGRTHSLPVGKTVIVRTVTFYYTGRLASVTDTDLVLEDAAWIPDTGRWHDALKTGRLSEIEPFTNSVIVSRGGVIDVTEWGFDLPRSQK